MSVELSFTDASYPGFFDHFSCSIQAGGSALVVTSGEAESSALTRLLTGLAYPSHGSVQYNSRELSALDSERLYNLRQQIGIVPANAGLVSNLKVWENITLPTIYHNGAVTQDEEDAASAYLAELGYTGNLMALPAHLSLPEKRIIALVRTWLAHPDVIVYSSCFEDLPTQQLATFSRLAAEFQARRSDRISLYLASSADLAENLMVDTIVHVHEPVKPMLRHI